MSASRSRMPAHVVQATANGAAHALLLTSASSLDRTSVRIYASRPHGPPSMPMGHGHSRRQRRCSPLPAPLLRPTGTLPLVQARPWWTYLLDKCRACVAVVLTCTWECPSLPHPWLVFAGRHHSLWLPGTVYSTRRPQQLDARRL